MAAGGAPAESPPARPPAAPAGGPPPARALVLNSGRIGQVHPAMRSNRAFSRRLCARACSRGVITTAAPVTPVPAVLRKSRRSIVGKTIGLFLRSRDCPWSRSAGAERGEQGQREASRQGQREERRHREDEPPRDRR